MHQSVAFTSDDTRDWGPSVAGLGLLLDIPREGRWLRRPSLHFEVAPAYRLRLTSGGQPLLWVRIDSYWDQCGFLRGTASAPWGLPPVTAAELRDVAHEPGTDRWWEAWTWRLGRVLSEPSHPLLYAGRWCLRPVRAIDTRQATRYPVSPMEWGFGEELPPPHSLEAISRFETFWTEGWGYEAVQQGAVLPLRAASPEDDGRVKSWRKRARDGTLPPALLLYVDLLAKWLVLDGHDRLHAALLEGVTPPLLGLWPVIERVNPSSAVSQEGALIAAEFNLRAGETPQRIDRVNRMLLHSFAGPRRGTVTRAWPLRGGLDAWRAEVLAWCRWNTFPAAPEPWEWFVSSKE
jgi:hypothetical protein